jgi:hypothetical protein
MVPISRLADWRLCDAQFLEAFESFGASGKFTELQLRHPLPREDRIVFHEGPHKYEVDGITVPRSATSLIHSYCLVAFDAAKALASMSATKRGGFVTGPGGRQMTDEEICAVWAANGKAASARGTLLHYHAEAHCNAVSVEPPHSPEFKMVVLLVDALRDMGFKPYRTEVCVIHIGLCCAGQIDALFIDDAGSLALLDWKRSKVTFDKCFRPLGPPLEHVPDCNGFLYMLQLALYKYICESEYGIRIDSLFLGVVHPIQDKPRLIRMPYLREEIEAIVEDQISRGLAVSTAVPGAAAPFRLPIVQDGRT